MSALCDVAGCGRLGKRRGWCFKHYQRWKVHGDPLIVLKPWGEAKRFFEETVLSYEGDECLIWPYCRDKIGYARLDFGGCLRQVARLVCEDTCGPPPTPEHEAAHSCGKGHLGCVAKRHLSWKTHTENMADKLIHGTHSRGERSGTAKLCEQDVRAIRALKGVRPQTKIAVDFGISRTQVRSIHSGRKWGWLQ